MVMNELEWKFLNALCEHYTIDLRQEKQDTTEEGYTCTFELFKAQKRIDIYVVDFRKLPPEMKISAIKSLRKIGCYFTAWQIL